MPSPGALNIKIKYCIPYVHLISFNTHPARLSESSKETQSKMIRWGFFFFFPRLKKKTNPKTQQAAGWTTQIPAAAFALDEIAIFLWKKPGSQKGFQIAPAEAGSCVLLRAFPNNTLAKGKGFPIPVTYPPDPAQHATRSIYFVHALPETRERGKKIKIQRAGDDPHERILINSSAMLHKVILLN